MKRFEESFLYILRISNKRFIDTIKSILFIKRMIAREIDTSEDKEIIILLLNNYRPMN